VTSVPLHEPPGTDPWMRRALLVVGVIAFAALTLLQTIGGVTRSMTVSGCPAASPAALQWGPGGADPATRADIVTGWHAYERTTAGSILPDDDATAATCRSVPVRPDELGDLPPVGAPSGLGPALSWFGVDIAFALLYGAWLALVVVWMRSRPPTDVVSLGYPLRFLAWRLTTRTRLLALPLVAALADVVENVVLRLRLRSWWDELDAGGVLTTDRTESWLLVVAGVVKWAAVGITIAIVLVGIVPVLWRVVRAVLRSLASSWLPLVVVLVFAMAVTVPDQSADALRRLSLWQWLFSLVVLAVFMVTLTVSAAGALRPRPVDGVPGAAPEPARAIRGDLLLLVGVALLGGVAVLTGRHGLFVPAAVIGLVALVSLLLDVARAREFGARALLEPKAGPPVPSRPGDADRTRVAAGIAVVPLLAVGVATISASTADAVLGIAPDLGAVRRVILGCLLVVATALLVVPLRRAVDRFLASVTWRRRSALLLALAAVHLPFALMHVPGIALGHAHRFGSLALLMVFLSGFVLIPGAAAIASQAAVRTRGLRLVTLPTLLRLMGFRSTPVLGLLVVWLLLAGTVANPGYHDVRRLDAVTDTRPTALTADDVARQWLDRQPGEPDGDDPDADPVDAGPVPALLAAASGGGIRAAFWTASVLDCIVERDGPADDPCRDPADPATVDVRRRAMLAMSGISGGSLGLASYVTAVDAAGGWSRDATATAPGDASGEVLPHRWYRDRLGADFLAPTIATYLFNDGLNALVRPRTGVDRGAVLERAWERTWPDDALAQPFLARQASGEQPLLLLNGFDVSDGCRVNTSVIGSLASPTPDDVRTVGAARCRSVDREPRLLLSTADLLAQLCPDDDVRFSTAALNSARFPFVSPAGRIASCADAASDAASDAGGARTVDSRTVDVVDGGYRETSGASTLVELWPAFAGALAAELAADLAAGADTPERCVVPVFVQIDNGPEQAVDLRRGADRTVGQWFAPVVALGSSAGGQEAAARQASRAVFEGSDDRPGAWYRITTFAHPGSSAPLGWVLSDTAMADLERQLRLNGDPIVGVRSHLDDPPAC
jgi:hypothetical protein